MAPDTAERHQLVAQLVGDADAVLDVGGNAGELRPFLRNVARVEAVNISGTGDRWFAGKVLPDPDNSFDTVTSLDVLEHVKPAERLAHVRECARVAARRVVLCCPFGSAAHMTAERKLAEWYTARFGHGHPFLEEHLANGLPTQDDMEAIAAALAPTSRTRILYHGDFRATNETFRRAMLARRRPTPANLGRLLAGRLQQRPGVLSSHPQPYTNRTYVVIDHR